MLAATDVGEARTLVAVATVVVAVLAATVVVAVLAAVEAVLARHDPEIKN